MASNKAVHIRTNKSFAALHKIVAGVNLLCFLVITVAGLRAEASTLTIIFRCILVFLVIGFISRLLIKAWSSFEGLSSDEA